MHNRITTLKLIFLALLPIILNLSSISIAAEETTDIVIFIKEIADDIEYSTYELNQLRENVTAVRKPLSNEIRALETNVTLLRKRIEQLSTENEKKESELTSLEDKVSRLESEIEFAISVLTEYRREMETRINIAETQLFLDELGEIDLLLSGEDTDALYALEPLLNMAFRKNKGNFGGTRFSGYCLDEQGIQHSGTFATFGPMTYFAAQDTDISGVVVTRLGSKEPSVMSDFTSDEKRQITTLTDGKEATPPLDVTLGDAYKIRTSRESWWEHIRKGGIVIIPILGIGFLCVIVIIWKFFSLCTIRTEVEPILDTILDHIHDNDIPQAEILARSLGEPLAPVILEGIEHRDASREHIEEILHERITSEIPMLERNLSVLAVCAAAAPLLGLLGTVMGMMHTFKLITIFGTGEAQLLSSGISEALITTQYGLIIAVPTLLAHAYLSRRVRKIIGTLEQTSIRFINDIKVRGNNNR
ncbi:MAG: MotA/TolQ/ExbB proton channel family protein [Spirochaetales bacterium]|nr:MotA/TolQ/ExbB proton channel family protein [Spirochaetales bacterium]